MLVECNNIKQCIDKNFKRFKQYIKSVMFQKLEQVKRRFTDLFARAVRQVGVGVEHGVRVERFDKLMCLLSQL